MMLDIKEVARLLSVSDKTLYRWISKNQIPAYKIGETYRFNRIELLEWATARKIKISYEIFSEPFLPGTVLPSLCDALEAGGIHYRVSGTDVRTVLSSIVSVVNFPADIEKEFLMGALLAREELGTTAIGDGIAIPHVRNPIVFHVTKPIMALCFLEEPVHFGALDGKPITTVFTLLTNTVRLHLHLLSRLSYLLTIPSVRRALTADSNRARILDAFSEAESSIKTPQSTL